MNSPLQRIAQHARHARHLRALARAASANGNPITARALRDSARVSVEVARAIYASVR